MVVIAPSGRFADAEDITAMWYEEAAKVCLFLGTPYDPAPPVNLMSSVRFKIDSERSAGLQAARQADLKVRTTVNLEMHSRS